MEKTEMVTSQSNKYLSSRISLQKKIVELKNLHTFQLNTFDMNMVNLGPKLEYNPFINFGEDNEFLDSIWKKHIAQFVPKIYNIKFNMLIVAVKVFDHFLYCNFLI